MASKSPVSAVAPPSPAPIFARQYALFYDQLGRQLRAGLPAGTTVANMLVGPVAAPIRTMLEDMRRRIEAGEAMGDTMLRHPSVIPRHEARFLQAAEAGGKLPAACDKLAILYQLRHQRVIRFAAKLVYPTVLLLAAIVISPAKLLVEGHVGRYVFVTGVPLVVLAAIGALGTWIAFAPAAGGVRVSLYAFARRLPVVGKALHQLAIARIGHLMALCFGAGLVADQVLRLAGESTPDVALRKACTATAGAVARGSTIATAMEAHPHVFPGTLVAVVRTGEESGNLDEALTKGAEFWQEDADRAIDTLVWFATGVLTLAAMGIVAAVILKIGLGIMHGVQEQIDAI